MTSRRGFLKLFGATVATAAGVMVLDPEAALWRPGEIRVITKADPRDVAVLVRLEFLMDAPDAPRRQLIQPCGPRS